MCNYKRLRSGGTGGLEKANPVRMAIASGARVQKTLNIIIISIMINIFMFYFCFYYFFLLLLLFFKYFLQDPQLYVERIRLSGQSGLSGSRLP